ncbi:hypothetical protein [Streptomyces lavendulae]|uniref:hypothetical protein n=1 Tax=Streptomyces lavendulae TaxID=1914 RepID=UPI0031ED1695
MSSPTDLRVNFHNHHVPKADPGKYTAQVEHELWEADDAGRPTVRVDDPPLTSPEPERFEIRAVRFVLDETSVHAVYPQPGASGAFMRVLPHITLNRSVLPWERDLSGQRARAPWIALMIFRAGELPDDPTASGLGSTRTVEKLLDPDEGNVLGPDLRTVEREVKASECRTLDIPREVFTAVVPTLDELWYLAHVRDVQREVHVPRLLDDGEVPTEGRFAVVAANRFAREGGSCAAHLVSLEGFERVVAGQWPDDGKEFVRVASLWSWSFTCEPDDDFDAAGLLENMVAPSLPDTPEELALSLRPPNGPPDPAEPEQRYVQDRLSLGYAPLPYRTPSGERTYSWYRGPFTPLAAQPVPPTEPVGKAHTTADHAMIYEAEHGLFDISYAAAWTLGRTVALADPDYSAEAVRARRELANHACSLIALAVDPERADVDPLTATRPTRLLRELAGGEFGDRLMAALSSPMRPAEAGPQAQAVTRLTPEVVSDILSDSRRRAALAGTARSRLGMMATWLDRLALLQGVPLSFLVPDMRMLPPESLRFFRIDQGWIDAYLAGAQDIGTHTSMDLALDGILRDAVTAGSGQARPEAGMLMNSALVAGWPAMGVSAWSEGGTVTELRRHHPAPDMLLCLFDKVPDEVLISEPSQGIHFGLNSDNRIDLRQLAPDSDPPLGATLPGQEFPAAPDDVFGRFLRPRPPGLTPDVLRLLGPDGLVDPLGQALERGPLAPRELAVELIVSPLEQRLRVPSAPADRSL